MGQIEFKLANVRCIETSTLRIERGATTALVGTNNSGKTSLLDAVVTVLRSLPGGQQRGFNSDMYREVDGRLLRPEVTVAIPTPMIGDHTIFAEPGELRLHYLAGRSTSGLEAGRPQGTSWAIDKMEVVFGQSPTAQLVRPIDSAANLPDLGGGVQYFHYDDRVLNLAKWSPIEPGTAGNTKWQGGRSADLYPTAVQASTPLLQALGRIAARVYYLPAGRGFSFGATNATTLLPAEGAASTGVLLHLRLKDRHWTTLNTALSLVFEEVQAIVFDEIGENPAPHAQFAHGARIPFDRMGFGFRNCVAILAELCAAPENAIVVIDEPEQGLNQSAQRELAAVIDGLRPDIALVLGTQAEAFCRGLSSAALHLAVRDRGTTKISPCDLRVDSQRRELARAMGVDPLLLLDDGKIIYVEGVSDELILDEWLELQFGTGKMGCQVQALGGGDKLNESFVQPMFRKFKDRLFFIIDADGTSAAHPHSDQTKRRLKWIEELGCAHFVLRRRELENYLGHAALAEAAGVNATKLRPPEGTDESWVDFKAQVKAALNSGIYDERRITVGAFKALGEARKALFGAESSELLDALKKFAGR